MTDERPSHSPDWQQEALRAARGRIDRVNDWLCLGGALPPADYGRLCESGITHVVDLREESDTDTARLRALGIEQRHVPVPDHGPPTIQQLVDVTTVVVEGHAASNVYVHCKGGFGRAATMAAGLLVAQGVTVDEAIAQVRQARPEMRLNDAQLEWLREGEQTFARDQATDGS
jgi:protein-tyrosine phosphatase